MVKIMNMNKYLTHFYSVKYLRNSKPEPTFKINEISRGAINDRLILINHLVRLRTEANVLLKLNRIHSFSENSHEKINDSIKHSNTTNRIHKTKS